MDWVLTIAMVFAAWAAMSLIGYERQRRLDATAAQASAAPPTAEPGPAAH